MTRTYPSQKVARTAAKYATHEYLVIKIAQHWLERTELYGNMTYTAKSQSQTKDLHPSAKLTQICHCPRYPFQNGSPLATPTASPTLETNSL
ncbi:hypothetical protein [uncultured Nostoc sp.]|uniref:hypothetical protein n=1 Tax=uncultured Nostoc sp. TaxID=340711 RepID=UPI0035CAD479